MNKEFWMNLPVKDINRSKEFFTKLGFEFKPAPANVKDLACLIVGNKNVAINLFSESVFKSFTGKEIADTNSCHEVLFSFSADSREEVDEWAKKAGEAGANVFAKPAESQGWMYGCGFADPDGHRWNALFMDMSKMPK